MSLLALPIQVLKKNVPYLTFPTYFAGFCDIFFPPKSKAHFAREKGGTSSMEPRSSPPREAVEADSRHSAVAPKRCCFSLFGPVCCFLVGSICLLFVVFH